MTSKMLSFFEGVADNYLTTFSRILTFIKIG